MDPGFLMMWQMLQVQHQAALGLQAMATPTAQAQAHSSDGI